MSYAGVRESVLPAKSNVRMDVSVGANRQSRSMKSTHTRTCLGSTPSTFTCASFQNLVLLYELSNCCGVAAPRNTYGDANQIGRPVFPFRIRTSIWRNGVLGLTAEDGRIITKMMLNMSALPNRCVSILLNMIAWPRRESTRVVGGLWATLPVPWARSPEQAKSSQRSESAVILPLGPLRPVIPG